MLKKTMLSLALLALAIPAQAANWPQNVQETKIVDAFPEHPNDFYVYLDQGGERVQQCVKVKNMMKKPGSFYMDGYWTTPDNRNICDSIGKRVKIKPDEADEICIAVCPEVTQSDMPVSYVGYAMFD